MTEQEFCEVVVQALKGDHNDLRKEAIILRAHRAALATQSQLDPQSRGQAFDGEGEGVRDGLARRIFCFVKSTEGNLTFMREPAASLFLQAANALSEVEGIDDDYMTSETHHPGYVLIPTAKFDAIVAALSSAKRGEEG